MSNNRTRFVAIARLAALGAVGLILFSACGTTRGTSCSADGDCDDGQVCSSPSCITTDKLCVVPCSSDDACHELDGPSAYCTGAAGCQKYCTPGSQ